MVPSGIKAPTWLGSRRLGTADGYESASDLQELTQVELAKFATVAGYPCQEPRRMIEFVDYRIVFSIELPGEEKIFYRGNLGLSRLQRAFTYAADSNGEFCWYKLPAAPDGSPG